MHTPVVWKPLVNSFWVQPADACAHCGDAAALCNAGAAAACGVSAPLPAAHLAAQRALAHNLRELVCAGLAAGVGDALRVLAGLRLLWGINAIQADLAVACVCTHTYRQRVAGRSGAAKSGGALWVCC